MYWYTVALISVPYSILMLPSSNMNLNENLQMFYADAAVALTLCVSLTRLLGFMEQRCWRRFLCKLVFVFVDWNLSSQHRDRWVVSYKDKFSSELQSQSIFSLPKYPWLSMWSKCDEEHNIVLRGEFRKKKNALDPVFGFIKTENYWKRMDWRKVSFMKKNVLYWERLCQGHRETVKKWDDRRMRRRKNKTDIGDLATQEINTLIRQRWRGRVGETTHPTDVFHR